MMAAHSFRTLGTAYPVMQYQIADDQNPQRIFGVAVPILICA